MKFSGGERKSSAGEVEKKQLKRKLVESELTNIGLRNKVILFS